jgi:lambda family phage minor tail protein L
MTTNEKIQEDIQKLNVGSAYVDMYTIDATEIGGSTYHFTPMTSGGQRVVFNGVEYSPLPVETEGFDWEGTGQMPRPILRISNINLTFVAAVTSFYDLVGAKLTRRRTFAKYLDASAEADPNAQFPADIFYIERKTRQNRYLIEFELKALVDIENTLIPKGQCISICSHRYRVWDADTGDWDGEQTCPYLDTPSFDEEGVPTSRENDKCGKKLYDCLLRYPQTTDQLPFLGFPSIGTIGYPYR